MIAWYETKENCSIQHAGQIIEPGQKILLTEELAALHNSTTEQVVACDAPVDFTEAAVKSDFDEWEANKPVGSTTSSKKSTTSTSTSTRTAHGGEATSPPVSSSTSAS